MFKNKLKVYASSGASIGELLALSYQLPKLKDTEINRDGIVFKFDNLQPNDVEVIDIQLESVIPKISKTSDCKIEWF